MIDELPAAPDPANDTPALFNQKAAALVLAQKKMVSQFNGSLSAFNAALAGGAYALSYSFSTLTTDGDPGAGQLRLSSATQNAATVMRLDTTAGGSDISSILDTFDASTSGVKGSFRIVKASDVTKFLTFDITARAAPSGYRNFTVTNTGGSSTSPFVNGDAVLVYFQRNGDVGTVINQAYQLLASADVAAGTAAINFLNIFTSAFDKYVVEVSGLKFSASSGFAIQLATAGALNSTGHFNTVFTPNGQITSTLTNSSAALTNLSMLGGVTHEPFTIEINNANDLFFKTMHVRGMYVDAANSYYNYVNAMGLWNSGNNKTISGFSLQLSAATFSSAKVRIYGIKNVV